MQSAPDRVVVRGELGVASSLRALIEKAGITVDHAAGDGCIEFGGVNLAMTDGRTATRRAADDGNSDTIVFDLAFDYTTSDRMVLAPADQCDPRSLALATGLFQAIGKKVSVIDDAPGMVVMRTVCMLANEGADAVHQGVCDVKSVDTAMRFGTGYPMGPLVWADRIGLPYVARTLDNLRRSYGEGSLSNISPPAAQAPHWTGFLWLATIRFMSATRCGHRSGATGAR